MFCSGFMVSFNGTGKMESTQLYPEPDHISFLKESILVMFSPSCLYLSQGYSHTKVQFELHYSLGKKINKLDYLSIDSRIK